MKKLIYIFILLAVCPAFAQFRVGNIYTEQKEVFEKSDDDWFFGSPLLNALHSNTAEYIVSDEIMFKKGDLIDDDLLSETERNLRATGLFNIVKIELDSLSDNTYDIYLETKDRWSFYPSALFGVVGDETNYGARLEEFNLLGSGTYIAAEGLYRCENNIGWQGVAKLKQRRLFRSEIGIDAYILAHQFRTEQNIKLEQTYRTLETPYAYGVQGINSYGKEFIYHNSDSIRLIKLDEQKYNAWFSKAWWRKDRVFITAWAEYHKVNRFDSAMVRAFDNCGKLLFGFSSVAQDFYTTEHVNSFMPEDISVGGWGSAVLGKVFPIGGRGGESMYYVAGYGERSYFDGKNYLFGSIIGASGFWRSYGKYTYEEFIGQAFRKLTKDLVVSAKISQQTTWNWDRKRQLIIDAEHGLRGYSLNSLSGDNRITSTLELRYFPNLKLAMFNIGAAAFWDAGSVWEKEIQLSKTQWHNAVGAGLRFQFTKSTNPNHLMRLDFAYNFDEKKFGGIIFTAQQMFSLYTNHEFKLPRIYGTEFDND